jgi:hypothetical protein
MPQRQKFGKMPVLASVHNSHKNALPSLAREPNARPNSCALRLPIEPRRFPLA